MDAVPRRLSIVLYQQEILRMTLEFPHVCRVLCTLHFWILRALLGSFFLHRSLLAPLDNQTIVLLAESPRQDLVPRTTHVRSRSRFRGSPLNLELQGLQHSKS